MKKIIEYIIFTFTFGLGLFLIISFIWILCWDEFKVTKDVVITNTAGATADLSNYKTGKGYAGFKLIKYKKVQGIVFIAQIECIMSEMEGYREMFSKNKDINDKKKYHVTIGDEDFYVTNKERVELSLDALCKSGYLYINLVSGEMIPGLSEDEMYQILKERHGITEKIKFRKNNLFSYERVFDFVF